MRWLSLLTVIFGIACCAIAIVHLAFGTASIPGAIPVNATLESEDSFFASLFLGFGLALVWCSRNLIERQKIFNFLLAVFFVGGLARILSMVQAGLPHPLFQFLTGVELVLPIIMYFWLRGLVRRQ